MTRICHSIQSIDMIGHLYTAIGGHKYILITVNYLTKWVEASYVASATAKMLQRSY